MLANWIVPNVTSNRLDGVAVAQNVIVVAHFPELAAVVLLELERGSTFEFLHEPEEVCVDVDSVDQEMEVIWHRAISMQKEAMLVRNIHQNGENHFGCRWRGQVGAALVAADREEIGSLAFVVLRQEAGCFAVMGHGYLLLIYTESIVVDLKFGHCI